MDSNLTYYVDKYGIFHRMIRRPEQSVITPTITETCSPKIETTWLRLIVMFWNKRVLKAAFRFGAAAVLSYQYERLGFAMLLLCLAL